MKFAVLAIVSLLGVVEASWWASSSATPDGSDAVSSDSPDDINPPSPITAADAPGASTTNDKNTTVLKRYKAHVTWDDGEHSWATQELDTGLLKEM